MDREALLDRARTRGVSPPLYWLVRAILQPFFHLYFRLSRTGREHIPARGPVILAANHRSFLDPFVIAVMARRPIYFVAKKEIFVIHPVISRLLNALGAFPIDRGGSDQQAMSTAKAILDRGEAVLMFAEGTRIRPGSLGRPKRGMGRLALETGAPVVPVAVHGTEAVRRGWRIRPHKVSIRAGRALTFPHVERPSAALAGAVTDRIWPCVELQWEWLGGLPPLRRAAVIGSGPRGASLAGALARAGLEVDLAIRASEPATGSRTNGAGDCALPPAEPPDGVRVTLASELELRDHDVVFFAVPARELPEALAAHAQQVPSRAGVVLVRPPAAGSQAAEAPGPVPGRAVVSLHVAGDASEPLAVPGEPVVADGFDEAFLAQLTDALRRAGLKVTRATGRTPTTTTRARRSRAA
ncbi:MAG: glycerol-3-phosphate dehydrogenase [Solirubrobacteraceae bacterium]|jgi:1-acyl-sn-glycerol-3-phosphate acyltransferase|nr:glycerol-3-phosphate dehydrogenase [Solirubrobacteraceae bacterium]